MRESVEAVAWTKYEVDCPQCGDLESFEEDPVNTSYDCLGCGVRIHVSDTR